MDMAMKMKMRVTSHSSLTLYSLCISRSVKTSNRKLTILKNPNKVPIPLSSVVNSERSVLVIWKSTCNLVLKFLVPTEFRKSWLQSSRTKYHMCLLAFWFKVPVKLTGSPYDGTNNVSVSFAFVCLSHSGRRNTSSHSSSRYRWNLMGAVVY